MYGESKILDNMGKVGWRDQILESLTIDGSIRDSENLIHRNDTIRFVFWKDSFGVYWINWSG